MIKNAISECNANKISDKTDSFTEPVEVGASGQQRLLSLDSKNMVNSTCEEQSSEVICPTVKKTSSFTPTKILKQNNDLQSDLKIEYVLNSSDEDFSDEFIDFPLSVNEAEDLNKEVKENKFSSFINLDTKSDNSNTQTYLDLDKTAKII